MSERDLAGTIVDGRYRLDERLDSGGLSTVWRGTDIDRDAPVAVKCENDGIHDPAQVRAHFRQELRWFRHFAEGPTPGSLVHFVDGSVDDGRCYVTTELIDGGSLGGRFDGDVVPGLDVVTSLAGPICSGVAFLHRNGVVHRDLKPTNVLERRHGPPAVIDLNSAVSSTGGTETLFHHDPFKPPELTPTDVRELPAGPWSDVYSLGKLLFYLLSGETLTCDESALSDWEPVEPRTHDVDCPPALARVIRRATAPHPDDRFGDAVAFLDALAPVLGLPNQFGEVEHEPTGVCVPVRPGDAIGRFVSDRRLPDVVLPDEDRYLSPVHAAVGWDGDGWILEDRSLNGTFVERDGSWRYILSRHGRERRRTDDATLPERNPLSTIPIEDGTRIAPVDPGYGCHLTFRTE